MSSPIALINPKHIFGFHLHVCDNLCYLNEHSLIFVAGTAAVIYNVDHHTQRFIFNVGKSSPHFMFLSPNRQYVAVGERSDDPIKLHLGIGIYETTTSRKVITLSALKLQRQLQQHQLKQIKSEDKLKFVSGAFSHDGKFVIGQVGPPEWTLIYWDVESGKSLALISLSTEMDLSPIHQVLFHPHDNNHVSIVGAKGYSLLLLEEGGNFKVAIDHRKQNGPIVYWCHSWVSDNRILVGCDGGTVVLIENNEIIQRFQIKISSTETENVNHFDANDDLDTSLNSETKAVLNLVTFSKGFICSCGGDVVYLFERYSGGNVYRQATAIFVAIDDDLSLEHRHIESKILTIAISPSEDVIAIATAQKIIYTFNLTSVDINKMGAKFEQLTPKIHCAALVDIDICLQKPIAITCSSDGAVAVWNYVTNQQQLYQYLDEQIYSIALHPTGHYIVVGCKSCLRLMGLMIDQIRTVHEFSVKECTASTFSNSGHLIAAVYGSMIVVFSTITFENKASFKGHVGKISAIAWSNDDLRIISSGVDGAVIEWDLYTHKRSNEVVTKDCFSNSITTSRDNFTVYVAGSDSVIREIAESQILGEVKLMLSVLPTSVIALHCGKFVVVSTLKGHIWIVPVPFTNQDSNCQQIQSMFNDGIKLRVTKDDKWLISISSDGFCIWSITDGDGRSFQTDDELPFLEEILITRADLEEKNLSICELNQQLKDIKYETSQERKLREDEHRNKINQLVEDYENKMRQLTSEIQVNVEKNNALRRIHEKKVQGLNDNIKQTVKRIQEENDQKLLLEYEKTDELQLANEILSSEFEQKLQILCEEKSNDVADLKSKYQIQLNKLQLEVVEAKSSLAEVKSSCDESIELLENEADEVTGHLKKLIEDQLEVEKQNLMKYQSEIGVTKRQMLKFEKDIDDLKKANETGAKEKQALQTTIKNLHQEINFLVEEIKSRDNLLQTKELELHDVKKKLENVEHLNTLWEMKSVEMNNQILSKQDELKMMTQKFELRISEDERVQQAHTKLKLQNQNFKSQIITINQLVEAEKIKGDQLQKKWIHFNQDLMDCVNSTVDSNSFKSQIIKLYKKYNYSK